MSQKHSFAINLAVNPVSERPFGDKYKGPFIVRRPTLADKRDIALREQTYLCGAVPAQTNRDVVNQAYIFSHLDVLCEKDGRPDWCHPSKMFEGEDEKALLAVWQEVDQFLKRFRTEGDSPTG